MKFRKSITALAALALALVPEAGADAKSFVQAQGRGVNLGNLLEAPSEGEWGIVLKKEDLALIASKGFTNIRMPIRWDGSGVGNATFDRVSRTPPYTVDPRFFDRVDSAIQWARDNHLIVVLNDHHHDSLFQNYEHERPRFIALWKQIAERYKDLPTDSVAFEILNEPNTQVTIEAWNDLLDTTLQVIRASNPTRPVVIGTANWGGLSGLSGLRLPAGDPNLILTVHYYEPFAFTHQGASWVTPVPPTGVPWEGTYYEKLAVRQAMDAIHDYATARDLPVFIGEFGAFSEAEIESRARWTEYCARLFESYGFSWSLWEFKAGFGVYDEKAKSWNSELMNALISDDTSTLALGTPPSGGVDLVVNGGFAVKTKWSLNAGQGAATYSIVDSTAQVEITDAASDAWGIQLIQKPIVLRAGLTHVLQFDAWASSPRAIDGTVGMSVDPWTGYVTAAASLGTTRKTFFASFVPGKDDASARVAFNLGPDTGKVFLDNVKVLYWDPGTSAIGAKATTSSPVVRLRSGELRMEGPNAPRMTHLTRIDGKVAPLAWTRQGTGWTASIPSLGPGLWLGRNQGQSFRLIVSD
ncbi:MAG: cellulase family glycosylhydrolase [Fibrobacteria bacterium]|nr:cellulase family glycosylhydrolase [Fibrobacteria bacterium]